MCEIDITFIGTKITLTGNIGINYIERIYNKVREIEEGDIVEVELKNVTKFDLSTVQLLFFLKNSKLYKRVDIIVDDSSEEMLEKLTKLNYAFISK